MSFSQMFSIAEFHEEDENTVEVIPTAWITENNMAFWPPPPKCAAKLARKNAPPQIDWPKFSMRILRSFGIV